MAMSQEEREARTANTPVGIAFYVHAFKPHSFPAEKGKEQKEPQYSLKLLVTRDDLKASRLSKIFMTAALSKFSKETIDKLMKKKEFGLPWRPASDWEEKGPPFDADDGAMVITAKNKDAPGIYRVNRETIIDPTEFFDGCKARMSVFAHPYDTMGNQGVTFYLNSIQVMSNKNVTKLNLGGKGSGDDAFDDELSEEGGGGEDSMFD